MLGEHPGELPSELTDEQPTEAGTGTLFEIQSVDGDYVRLYRWDERRAEWVMHGRFRPDEASEEKIGELFGGGRFMAHYLTRDASNKLLIRRRREFIVPGLYKPPREMYGLTQNTPVTAGTVTVAGPTAVQGATATETLNMALVSQVIEMMRAQREALAQPRGDGGTALVTVIGVLMPLLERVFDRMLAPKDDKLAIELERVRAELANLKNAPGPATSAITDALGGIERILKVSRDVRRLAEPIDTDANPDSAMWNMGAKLLDALNSGSKQGPSQVPQLPPGAQPGGQPQMPLWQQLLVGNRARLLDSATRGVDPALVAEIAIQFASPQMIGVTTEFVQRPDMVSVAMQVLPELQQFPVWTQQFFDALRVSLLPEAETDDSEEAETEQ